jgi:hypothetical protein
MRKSWYNINFNKMKKVGIFKGHIWEDRNFKDEKVNNALMGRGFGLNNYTLILANFDSVHK